MVRHIHCIWEGVMELRLQQIDDLPWRADRDEASHPKRDFVVRHAGFLQCRHIGKSRGANLAGHSERPQRPLLELGCDCRSYDVYNLSMSGNRRLNCRSATLEGHVNNVETMRDPE